MKRTKHYFTLIEILTVAAIIAILAGISVGAIALISNKNAEAKTQATIKALELALAQYKADHGHIYPTSLKTPIKLTVPKDIPANLKGTLLKYLDQQLLNSATQEDGTNLYFVDAWNRPLVYRVPGYFNKAGFDLGSVGPDGKLGDNYGNEVTKSKMPSSSNFNSYFGKGDDITNFQRKD